MIEQVFILLLIIAIIGLIAWAITTVVPMPQPFKTLIIVVALLLCLFVVYKAFGGGSLAVPRIR